MNEKMATLEGKLSALRLCATNIVDVMLEAQPNQCTAAIIELLLRIVAEYRTLPKD